QPYCRFNARVLHRIGLFRAGLHFLLEASEPPMTPTATPQPSPSAAAAPAAADPAAESTAAATAAAGRTGDPSTKSNKEAAPLHGRPAAAAASAANTLPIAGFGGIRRPTAAVAAAGLDIRDGFMVSCTLLLQRVLAMCTIQRDFDRVVGATLSTLADGDATGARESRRAGSEPAFAPAETVLREVGLLAEEAEGGDGGGGGVVGGASSSPGDKVLSGQGMVRLYLVRMLLEIITLPVAAATKGELGAAEGVYVGGVGSPCAREAQRVAEEAAAEALVSKRTSGDGERVRVAGTRLERWIDGVPPVVDVVAADGRGLPSPLYVGRQRVFRSVCSKALRPDWFVSLLETCQEEAGVAWTFRLLAAMLQSSDEFGSTFQDADGYRAMAVCLPRYAASLPVLLPALALALGVPVAALPATAEDMDAVTILSLLRRNAGTAPGPGRGSGGASGVGTPRGGNAGLRPFVRVCLARVILPSLRVNAALLRRAVAAGEVPAAAADVGALPSRARAPTPPPTGGNRGRSSSRGAGGGSSDRGSPKSGEAFVKAGPVAEASDWRRAKRVNEVVSAAMWEALMNDPSFRLSCRSPGVVGALVDVLGGTWDEPEEGGAVSSSKEEGDGGSVDSEEGEEVKATEGGGGGGGGHGQSGSTSGGSASAEGFPPQASPHPPAELLRIVIADIVASGGGAVFPSLVRVFSSGAAVMGPMLREPAPGAAEAEAGAAADGPAAASSSLSSAAVEAAAERMPRDVSPLGREAGSASAGSFQRAMLRHLETCSRDAIAIAAATALPRSSSRSSRLGKSSPSARTMALNRALGSVAAVSAAVAEAAAEGLLPGVETGHLAVGLVLSLLRQISAAVGAMSGAPAGVRGTALGACHVTTVVALRRAIQRESGRGGWLGGRARGRSESGANAGRDLVESWSKGGDGPPTKDSGLLQECLLMIAHNFDALLGEERRSTTAGTGGIATSLAGTSSVNSPAFPPPPPMEKSPLSPKLRSPVSSASNTPHGGRESGGRRTNVVPPPLDLSGTYAGSAPDGPL
ncbi:unnamed protein product, partial [Hapterophycus canaliculatus]